MSMVHSCPVGSDMARWVGCDYEYISRNLCVVTKSWLCCYVTLTEDDALSRWWIFRKQRPPRSFAMTRSGWQCCGRPTISCGCSSAKCLSQVRTLQCVPFHRLLAFCLHPCAPFLASLCFGLRVCCSGWCMGLIACRRTPCHPGWRCMQLL